MSFLALVASLMMRDEPLLEMVTCMLQRVDASGESDLVRTITADTGYNRHQLPEPSLDMLLCVMITTMTCSTEFLTTSVWEKSGRRGD